HVKLPRLEKLVLDFDGKSCAPVLALLAELPPVRHLGLSYGHIDPRRLRELPHLDALTSLSLTNFEIGDDDIANLELPHLTELDLSFNELTRVGLAAAKALATTVVSKRQHKPGNASEKRVRRFAGSRLTVAEGIADPKLWKRAGIDGDLRWARYRGEAEY